MTWGVGSDRRVTRENLGFLPSHVEGKDEQFIVGRAVIVLRLVVVWIIYVISQQCVHAVLQANALITYLLFCKVFTPINLSCPHHRLMNRTKNTHLLLKARRTSFDPSLILALSLKRCLFHPPASPPQAHIRTDDNGAHERMWRKQGLLLRRSDSRFMAANLVFLQRCPAELVMRLRNVLVSYGSASHTITPRNSSVCT